MFFVKFMFNNSRLLENKQIDCKKTGVAETDRL